MDSVFLIKGTQLLLSLSILVILHELGHFVPAKIFKTRVEKFFLFFDVKFALFKKKIGETVYGIGWLPLGGYVKISGMVDESMDTEQLSKPAEPWEFRSKPAWQRLIIMLGGIIVNILVAFLIYSMILFVWGKDSIDSNSIENGIAIDPKMEVYGFRNGDKILSVNGEELDVFSLNRHLLLRNVDFVEVIHTGGTSETLQIPDSISDYIFKNNIQFSIRGSSNIGLVADNSPAKIADLRVDDQIIAINQTPVQFSDEAQKALKESNSRQVDLLILRDQDTLQKTVTLSNENILGISFKHPELKFIHADYSFASSVVGGIQYGAWSLHDYVVQLKFLFTKKGSQSLGGLGTIAGLFPAEWDWSMFWERTALLSVILAVMNLLPIPALDGGHVVFLIYEITTRRKPRQKVLEYAQLTGFVILMTLMIYANGKDIYNYFLN